jgi:hypothetical protein
MPRFEIVNAPAPAAFDALPARSLHTCVSSPPYYKMRDYAGLEPGVWDGAPGCPHDWDAQSYRLERHGDASAGPRSTLEGADRAGQTRLGLVTAGTCRRCGAWRGHLGQEPTPELFVTHLVGVFRALRTRLRPDGTLWVNIADSYATRWPSQWAGGRAGLGRDDRGRGGEPPPGYKNKDLIGVPWMLALAMRAGFAACTGCGLELRADLWPRWNGHRVCIDCLQAGRREAKIVETEAGWHLRSDCIWFKPNALPESVRDRPAKAHEYLFLFGNGERYFYDPEAVREPGDPAAGTTGRNRRTVWAINTQGFPGTHFATFPVDLPSLCIRASTSERGCCPACAAPWARIVSAPLRAHDGETETKYDERSSAGRMSLLRQAARERGEEYDATRETLGWRPTCSCGCAPGVRPDDFDVIGTPTGTGEGADPTAQTGRAGLGRPRGAGEGRRYMTRYEQRGYAAQLRALKGTAQFEEMVAEAGGPTTMAHYLRTDAAGARPVPEELLGAWIRCDRL